MSSLEWTILVRYATEFYLFQIINNDRVNSQQRTVPR